MEKKLPRHVRKLRASLAFWSDALEASSGRLSAEMLAAEAMNSGARNSRNALNHALGLADHFRTSKAGMLKAYSLERGRRWRDDSRLAQEPHGALDRYHDWAKERWNYGPHSALYHSTLADLLSREPPSTSTSGTPASTTSASGSRLSGW